MYRFVLLFSILFCPSICPSSELDSFACPSLSLYISQGLENNLALQRKDLSYSQSLEILKESRGFFLPSVDFGARYTRAGGGRIIDIPIGDLANPIYRTLNELLVDDCFPTDIPNQHVPFLRRKEHETRFRITQQILNLQVLHSYRASQNLAEVNRTGLAVFKRNLINEIETSYFNYLKTLKIIENYEQSLKLLEENLRVTRKLFEAEKMTRDAIYRAETQYHRLEQQREETENKSNLARSHFNFLLNRPLGAEVLLDSISQPVQAPELDMQAMKALALQQREELLSLSAAMSAARQSIKVAESSFLPSFALVADYGYQGESYSFTGNDDYWIISGVFQWNLFNGFTDKARLSRSRMELRKLENALVEAQRQVELEVVKSLDNLNSAFRMLKVSRLASRSAGENFRMVARKYEEGLASHIEYLDAQTNFTSSRIEETVTLYDYLIKLSELKLAVSAYELENL